MIFTSIYVTTALRLQFKQRETPDETRGCAPAYSHSIVPGGLDVTS